MAEASQGRGRLSRIRVVAWATYAETVRRPIFYILLFAFAFLVFFSQFIALYSFKQEANMIREMGVASCSLWGFLIIVIVSGLTVTAELENRTAVVMLSKPIGRNEFLLGKYFGLTGAVLTGVLFLGGVLFLTLWWRFGQSIMDSPMFQDEVLRGRGTFSLLWEAFIRDNLIVVVQGLLLTALQMAILCALCVSFAAFLPHPVNVTLTAILFILGNISSYMVGSISRLEIAPLTGLVRFFSWVMPNLGYFNLQSHFGEGRIISISYLLASSGYAVLYIVTVFFVAGSMFGRREIG